MIEKEFIESYLKYPILEYDKIDSILYFSLIWNIFEKKYFNKNAKISQVKKFIENIDSIDAGIPNDVFNYYKARYIFNSEETYLFKSFEFKSSKYKKITLQLLIEADSEKEKLEALMYIAFRLRNNLFHGEKEVDKLYDQNENFKQMNSFLIKLIRCELGHT